jgi:hypothetical protein
VLVNGGMHRRSVVVALAILGLAVACGIVPLAKSPRSSFSAEGGATDRPAEPPAEVHPLASPGPLGEADGLIPEGTTVSVFDNAVPAVAKLDAHLRDALRRAATDAAAAGVRIRVTSGWRSSRYQDRLLQDAVSRYGSQKAAARWVATPETSPHVSGEAVDVRPSGAATWLARHGSAYGLCRIYGNEPWHYELRASAAAGRGCPPAYADPTADPRMQ